MRVARHLRPGVHAAVGAPGHAQLERGPVETLLAENRAQHTLELRLHGALLGLARPAGEVGAVVLERELGDHLCSGIHAARTRRGDSDELDEDHLGGVAATRPQLQDARVATGPLRIAGSDLREQLVHGELVLRERR